jgi:hypothetical protein
MAVRTDHNLSRKDKAPFGKKDMLDPAPPDLKVMGKALGLCELSKNFALLGRRNIFGGREVIRDEDDPIPVEDPLYTDFLKGLDGKRCGDVVGEGKVNPHIDQLARENRLFTRMGSKNLFRDGHGILFLHIHPIQYKKVKAKVEGKKRNKSSS